MKTDRQLGQPIAPGETVTEHGPSGTSASNMMGAVDAILEVGRQRNIVLNQMRAALQSGNDSQALNLARQLCGLQK